MAGEGPAWLSEERGGTGAPRGTPLPGAAAGRKGTPTGMLQPGLGWWYLLWGCSCISPCLPGLACRRVPGVGPATLPSPPAPPGSPVSLGNVLLTILQKNSMDPQNPRLAELPVLEILDTSSLESTSYKERLGFVRTLQPVCPSPQLPGD